ncbi:MAG: urea ABC transporter permease subunit UrtB [Haliea sp.]|nr:urea ABC transporter permease subunit UrtB [Haliea sp.]
MPAQIEVLVALNDSRVVPVLQAMLDGRLYRRKSDNLLFIGVPGDDKSLAITNPLGGSETTVAPASDLSRVAVNNRMRGQLRLAIAQLNLASEDEQQRFDAAQELLGDVSPPVIALLNQVAQAESSERVLAVVADAQALAALQQDDALIRLKAVEQLTGNLQPVVLNALQSLTALDAGGAPLESDPLVYKRALKAIAGIKQEAEFYSSAETIFFGLSLGSVLLLSAIGLAITFGVMGVINMAHGELIMLGAYTTYVVQLVLPNHLEYSLLVAVPLAFVVSGLVGVGIERGVIRFLYGRPLETLLATFGISLILQQAVRSIFSPLNRSVANPEWMSGALQLNPLFSLTYNRLYILVFSLVVFFLLLALLKRTRLGLQFRAVAQNRAMARAMGIRSAWVDAMTFGLGSGIAGIAGVALSQLTNVGPNLGQAYIIDSFMVVVFGGVGNLWGTLVSAFSLGMANKFIEPVAGAVLAKILVLIFIILFIQRYPRGLFPQQGRSVD